MNCEVLKFESWGIKSISSILLNKTTAFKFVVCQVRNPLKKKILLCSFHTLNNRVMERVIHQKKLERLKIHQLQRAAYEVGVRLGEEW